MSNKKFDLQPIKAKNDIYQRMGSAAVLLILLLGITFVCFAYRTQNLTTKQYLSEIAIQSADKIHAKIENNLRTLESTAVALGAEEAVDEDRIEKLLFSELSLYDNDSVVRLAYLYPDGTGIEVNHRKEIKKIAIPPNTPYFRSAIENKHINSSVTTDPITSNKVHVYAVPVIRDGKVIAVHTGVFLTSKVKDIININFFNNKGQAYIITHDGIPLFKSNANDISGFVNDGLYNSNIGIITLNIAKTGRNSFISAYNGKYYWITYTPINYNNWYFVLIVPNSSINERSDKVVIFSAIILLSMLITSVLFLRHMDTMQSENRDRLYELACIDELTQIYNKTGFAEILKKILCDSSGNYAIVYFDLNNFEAFNDLFGYPEGDKLLIHAATVLTDSLKENESCSRFDGDNFYALMGYSSQFELESRLTEIMKKFSEYEFSDGNANSYEITCHCGIFLVNRLQRDRTVEFYVDRAKMAFNSGSKSHSNSFSYYDENLRKNLIFETELENDLKQGLENEDFKVYIQPKYSVSTQTLSGGEALIRWQHPTKGFLTPNRFCDIFEKNGQITEIDFYVLEHVCKLQRELIDLGFEPVIISVNQSRMHLFKKDYLDRLRAMITKYDLDPGYIELEITETVAMSNSQMISQAVTDLHKIGFKVSIDDFGSGQSSLNLLKDIEIDVIKLDRAFFIALTNSPKGKEIIKTIIGMASRLNIETVSEGIETQEQFNFIKMAGCDLVQGFLFGKPMPLPEFRELFIAAKKTSSE